MTSWCNGAPGYVFLWNTAFEQSGDARFAELAEAAARETMTARDHVGSLCCGYPAGPMHWAATGAPPAGANGWTRAQLAALAREAPMTG